MRGASARRRRVLAVMREREGRRETAGTRERIDEPEMVVTVAGAKCERERARGEPFARLAKESHATRDESLDGARKVSVPREATTNRRRELARAVRRGVLLREREEEASGRPPVRTDDATDHRRAEILTADAIEP